MNLKIIEEKNKSKIYIIVLNEDCEYYSFDVLRCLREKNFVCDINYNIKSLSSELKWAEKLGYDFAIIVGENEAEAGELSVKNIKEYKQYKINWRSQKEKLIDLIKSSKD